MRWLIRYEPVRTPKFGETRRDVSKWVVRAYVMQRGTRVFVGDRIAFDTIAQAHRWARGRAVIHYHGDRRSRRAAMARLTV